MATRSATSMASSAAQQPRWAPCWHPGPICPPIPAPSARGGRVTPTRGHWEPNGHREKSTRAHILESPD
eukprot:CAMPEP_0204565102 /NCGR_PEP_ID=MMETSP0661-20131031/35280_1 /ASSEMBLY_ACC=CAM_ASM_000606 /TAXON_ID=109239 /ORGANISM="Alexandrium margalefi, Strain AMGDE01CS-322" /LENGTH=68 /DNA_ID=CAMNT_0051572819 /DNA_START=6 /DNA_END=212 /DNA_ORIENTATION=+